MAHTTKGSTVLQDGTKIKIATGTYGDGIAGKTQTIKIYEERDPDVLYSEVYRISEQDKWVSEADIAADARNLAELDSFLSARGAVKEGPR